MECAQIEVTGGTGAKTPQTYSIPGIYKVSQTRTDFSQLLILLKANDPGITIDIYNNKGPYVIPGT